MSLRNLLFVLAFFTAGMAPACAQPTGPTSTGGSGGGTPGGSNTQLQYNNSSAFGGTSFIWDVTRNGIGDGTNFLMKWYAPDGAFGFRNVGDTGFANIEAGSIEGTGITAHTRIQLNNVYIVDSASDLLGSVPTINLGSTGIRGWTSTATGAPTILPDVAFGRNAAGIVEVNNGTAGTFNDLKLRNIYTGTSAAAPALTSCGTSPVIASGSTDMAGQVTMGTATPAGCVITFNITQANAPFCTVTWQINIASMQYTVSTSAITLVQTATSSNKVNYICVQH